MEIQWNFPSLKTKGGFHQVVPNCFAVVTHDESLKDGTSRRTHQMPHATHLTTAIWRRSLQPTLKNQFFCFRCAMGSAMPQVAGRLPSGVRHQMTG